MILIALFVQMLLLLLMRAPVVAPFSFPSSTPCSPTPDLKSIPLPVKLAGGLFLFQTSVKGRDKELSKEILIQAEAILRQNPLICMELGTGLEAGGVFSSSSSIEDGVHQLVMEFQLNGGNSWAQCRCHGLRFSGDNRNISPVELISLSVSNMDAALNGGWVEVTIPKANRQSSANEED